MILKSNPIKIGKSGKFKVKVLDANGKEKKDSVKHLSDFTTNVVTNRGLIDLIGYPAARTTYAKVGSGNSEIVNSDTALGSPLSPKTGNSTLNLRRQETDNGDGTATSTTFNTYSFAVGEIVGNISEVGIYNNFNDNLVAGQLIKDEFGNPTTITIQNDEQLIIEYSISLTYPSVSQVVGTGTITTPTEGSVGYKIYAHPLFADYDIGETDNSTRYKFNTSAPLYVQNQDTSIAYQLNTSSNDILTLDVANGTISYKTPAYSMSPSSFNSSTIRALNPGYTSSFSNVNFTTGLPASVSTSSANNHTSLVFDSTITKTSSELFEVQWEITLQV